MMKAFEIYDFLLYPQITAIIINTVYNSVNCKNIIPGWN